MHSFILEDNHDAAEWNKATLQENNNDYSAAISTQPNSAFTPGSEFRPIEAIEKLLKFRSNWPEIKSIIQGGCWYPMSDPPDDFTRLSDLKAMILRGNHKFVNHPNHKPIVCDKYIKDIQKSWMIPILVSYLPQIQHAEVIPIGLAFQKTFNNKGDIIDKERLTHDHPSITESSMPPGGMCFRPMPTPHLTSHPLHAPSLPHHSHSYL